MTAPAFSIDELDGDDGDVAFAAFCDEPCQWAGEWHHSDNMDSWPAPSAADEAMTEAEADGIAHLAEEHTR